MNYFLHSALILYIIVNIRANEVYRFEFNEGAGTFTYDHVNGHSGELLLNAGFSTAEYITSPSSLHFPSDLAHLYVAPQPEYDVGYVDWTLEFFVKISSSTKLVPILWAKEEGSLRNYGVFTTPHIVQLELQPLKLYFSSASTSSSWDTIGVNTLLDNQWHHIAVVYLHNETRVRTYIDFQLDATASMAPTVPGANVNVGGITSGTHWVGYIDSVVMHDYAMDVHTLNSTVQARIDGNQELCDGADNDGSGVIDDGSGFECSLLLDAELAPINQTSQCMCSYGTQLRVCQPIRCAWEVFEPCAITCPPSQSTSAAPTSAVTVTPTNIPTASPSNAPTRRPTLMPTSDGGVLASNDPAQTTATLDATNVKVRTDGDIISDANLTVPIGGESDSDYALIGGLVGVGVLVACLVAALLCALLHRRQRRGALHGRKYAQRSAHRRNTSLSGSRSGYASRRLATSGTHLERNAAAAGGLHGSGSRRSTYAGGDYIAMSVIPATAAHYENTSSAPNMPYGAMPRRSNTSNPNYTSIYGVASLDTLAASDVLNKSDYVQLSMKGNYAKPQYATTDVYEHGALSMSTQ